MNPDWLHQLHDPAGALETASAALRESALSGMDQLQWLVNMDIALQPYTVLLTRHYSDALRLPAEEETRLWMAGHGYHESLANALEETLHNKAQPAIPASETPSIIARILQHRNQQALWHFLRYVPTDSDWWLHMHKLYAQAEQDQLATQSVSLYPDTPQTTCSKLYLEAALLNTLNRTNMTKQQIVAVSQWLQQHTADIVIERDFDEDRQLFFVNLDEDRGGRRIRNFDPLPSCRYWATDALEREIEIELEKAELGQPAEIDVEILRQMHVEWSRTGYKRQRRTDERNEVKKIASIAHGIYAVCQEVHNQAMGHTHLALEGETWTIENESRNGFGALVSLDLNTWLKVGRLITLREELNFGMGVVAVIRSLQQQGEHQVYIGAEVLSYMALYAQLKDATDAIPQPFPGLFLASDDDRQLPSSLILPAIEYQPQAELHLKLDRRLRRVQLGAPMEQKDDWCRVEVTVLDDLI